MPLILILRPLECFAIVGAELKRVMSLGQFMAVEGTVRSQQVEDGQDGLRRLAELCQQLRIEIILRAGMPLPTKVIIILNSQFSTLNSQFSMPDDRLADQPFIL